MDWFAELAKLLLQRMPYQRIRLIRCANGIHVFAVNTNRATYAVYVHTHAVTAIHNVTCDIWHVGEYRS